MLEPGGVGRVGLMSAEGIVMLPVNYAIAAKTVVFRTAPDALLAAYAKAPVSFEAGHLDEAAREGWSVLVQGRAHKIVGEDEVRSLEQGTRLEPRAAGARDVWVRITPGCITGRRIRQAQAPNGSSRPSAGAFGVPARARSASRGLHRGPCGFRPLPGSSRARRKRDDSGPGLGTGPEGRTRLGPKPLLCRRAAWCARDMMTGAKIILDTGMDAARDGLADLAGVSWMMSLPQRQAAYAGHPAGRGRPELCADGGAGLVAVMFGNIAAPAADHIVLPVCWESVEPGDEFTVQLHGSITLAPAAAHGHSALTLTGVCQVPSGTLTAEGCEQVILEFKEASREFITSVARDVTRTPGADLEHDLLGPSWAW